MPVHTFLKSYTPNLLVDHIIKEIKELQNNVISNTELSLPDYLYVTGKKDAYRDILIKLIDSDTVDELCKE